MNSTRSRVRSALLANLAVASLLSACSPMPSATIDGPAEFREHALRQEVDSPSSAEDLARCFEESAGFLPGSMITPYPASGEFTYRLRAGQFVFESIVVSPRLDGGSRAVVEVTPDYKHRMRDDFVSNRLAPLYRCAGRIDTPRWPVQSFSSAATPPTR
jgi:hypothetical protein